MTSRTPANTVDEMIQSAGRLALEHNERDVIAAIESLREVLSRTDLSHEQRQNAQFALVTALQHRGEHSLAIETIAAITVDASTDDTLLCWLKGLTAKSLEALGRADQACEIFEEALGLIKKGNIDSKVRAAIALEAGKAFHSMGKDDRARSCWEESLAASKDDPTQQEHACRAKANLAFLLLNDPDEENQKSGLSLLEDSSNTKRMIGDIDGLANNYCNLGMYYWKTGRYERAIAYMRRDLFLSRKVGDQRAIAATLGNISQLYMVLKQFSRARELLAEAKQIGERLHDIRLLQITADQLALVNQNGKDAGLKGDGVGPAAKCLCGSGMLYPACCGRADFEPIDIPVIYGGVSEDLAEIEKESKAAGVEMSSLDFILRHTDQSKRRLAWSRIHSHDGWLEMHELPDMANHHLISARALAREAMEDESSPSKPLACAILSACALEAFINQVAYFVSNANSKHEGKLHTIPTELLADVMEYQRTTRLEDKWDILGKALCGASWPPPQTLKKEFTDLVYIRNELVHFKVADYEQVVPSPQSPHPIMKRIPPSVTSRSIPHAWPARVLTPSFAEWCVTVADRMMAHFREGYAANRFKSAQPAAQPYGLPVTPPAGQESRQAPAG